MLRRIERINRKSFRDIFHKTTLFHTPHLLIRVSPSNKGVWRGSVVVSKRVIRKAVDRNQLKRRIYNILGEQFSTLSNSSDLIVFAKKGIGDVSYSNLEKEVVSVLTKTTPKIRT